MVVGVRGIDDDLVDMIGIRGRKRADFTPGFAAVFAFEDDVIATGIENERVDRIHSQAVDAGIGEAQTAPDDFGGWGKGGGRRVGGKGLRGMRWDMRWKSGC